MSLSNQQRRYLRGLSHSLKPVVTVAAKGLSETVLEEIELALDRHELVKIRMRGEREIRKAWSDAISQQFSAIRVHQVGHVACYYRRNVKKPLIEFPGS